MTRAPNPLATLGIPVWLVAHELAQGQDGLERLKAHIERVVRAARRLYHDDIGRYRNEMLLAQIDEAAQDLDDLSVIAHYAKQLVNPTGNPLTAQARQLAEQGAASDRQKLQVLLRLVPFVDSAAVLLAEHVEVVLGSRQNLLDDEFAAQGTYALEVGSGGLGMLRRLHHPIVSGVPAEMHYMEPPQWDETTHLWQSEYVRPEVGGVPEICQHSFQSSDLFGARLVGGLSLDDARALAQRPQAGRATRALMGGAPSEDPGDLIWYQADYAWWLEAMRAPVDVDDIAVLVNDATGLMALGGRIVTMRFFEL